MLLTIVGIPLAVPALRMAAYSLWAFGDAIVTKPQAGGGSARDNIVWIVFARCGLLLVTSRPRLVSLSPLLEFRSESHLQAGRTLVRPLWQTSCSSEPSRRDRYLRSLVWRTGAELPLGAYNVDFSGARSDGVIPDRPRNLSWRPWNLSR